MVELEIYDYEEDPSWWDRFDSPTSDLTISLGKDKATGYKIIGSMDSKGGMDISGYGKGDFMSKKSDFSLYDADKNLTEQKVYKDGKISSSTVVNRTRMNDGGQAVEETKSKYTNGVFASSINTVKDLRTGNIVTKSTRSHTKLNDDVYIEEIILVGKYGKSPDRPKVTEKNIILIEETPYRTSTEYYAERITDGISDVVIDRMAELEDIKKSYIQLSKSVDKAAKSNNNMLPESQRLTGDFTNQDVLDRMGELDNEINQAELQFSKKADADPKLLGKSVRAASPGYLTSRFFFAAGSVSAGSPERLVVELASTLTFPLNVSAIFRTFSFSFSLAFLAFSFSLAFCFAFNFFSLSRVFNSFSFKAIFED